MFLNRKAKSSCNACGEESHTSVVGSVQPTHPGAFHTPNFELVFCPKCESVFLNPTPTSEDLRILYEDSAQFTDDLYTSPDEVSRILHYYESAVKYLKLVPKSGSRVLEVGAGYAWISRASKKLDAACTTVAQDISAECADKCDWVDTYHVGAIELLSLGDPFDLISMTHVIEHLVSPHEMLETLAPMLKPGGKLFITAPHRPKGWTQKMGIDAWRSYSYLHVPAHVNYFSKKWFKKMAPRYGLSVVHWDARHDDGQAFELVLLRK